MTHLRADLARRFPGERFLILHYGDHQPTATQTLLGFDENASIEDIVASGSDAARTTYYAIDAVRYRPPPLPRLEMLDVAYLGTVLIEAAGLPLPDSYRERRRLMLLCAGRYHDCPAREEILTLPPPPDRLRPAEGAVLRLDRVRPLASQRQILNNGVASEGSDPVPVATRMDAMAAWNPLWTNGGGHLRCEGEQTAAIVLV